MESDDEELSDFRFKKFKKESKWDTIARKCYSNSSTNNFNIKSDTLKTFSELNFINKNDMNILNGNNEDKFLDPNLLMNLRHNLIKNDKFKDIIYYKIITQKDFQKCQLENQRKNSENLAINLEISKLKNSIKSSKNEKLGFTTFSGIDLMKNDFKFEVTTKNYYSKLILKNDNNLEHSDEISKYLEISSTTTTKTTTSKLSENYRMFAEFEEFTELNRDSEEVYESAEDSEKHTSNSCSTSTLESPTITEILTKISNSSEEEDVSQNHDLFEPQLLFQKQKFLQALNPKISIKSRIRDESEPPNFLIRNNIIRKTIINPIDNPENEKIIEGLFKVTVKNVNRDYDLELLRKVFQKWCVILNLSKISSQSTINRETRVKKINNFLTNIRQEKNHKMKQHISEGAHNEKHKAQLLEKPQNKINAIIISKKFRQKLKVQEELIEFQKLKLERQEQIITELKLSKMFDESKHSNFEIKTELNNIIRNGTVRLRTKAKCLQINSNLKDETNQEENIEINLQAKGSEAPTFLVKMQARAVERSKKHAEAREKRERLQKEKEEAKTAAEDAKRLEDEKAKQERFEELREKRRQEKLQKILRERDRQRFLENLRKAIDFYRIKLLKVYGINLFQKLIQLKRRNEKKARLFRHKYLMMKYFRGYKYYTAAIWRKKKEKAEQFYSKINVRCCMIQWKRTILIAQSKMLVAIDLYELRLCEKIINYWWSATKQSLIRQEHKIRQAESHYNWHLQWKSIDRWQRLHSILKIEKETEERRLRWRIKIWELIPDYEPVQTE